MNKAEEQAVIRLASGGDRAAAEQLVKAHQRSLYIYLLRLSGHSDVAEDVVQEAFFRALTNLAKFDPRFRFSTWLFTIAKRVYLNICEKKKPISVAEGLSSWIGGGAGPQARAATEERQDYARDAIQVALMQLSLEQRDILILFHMNDWPIWLIAQHLEMPEGTVKSHLHRGRKRLREVLEEMNTPAARFEETFI